MTQRTNSSSRSGFTLVELSLAIVFVAILAMAILTISLQLMKIYSKGVTLKSVNQASRDISDQLTRDMRSTPSNQIYTTALASGRLCIGSIAYVWNTTSVLNGGPGTLIKYNGTPVRLMRISDPGHTFCSAVPLPATVAATNTPTELLGNAVNDLAVYNFSAQQFVTNQSLYTMNFTIGTNDQTVVSGGRCRPPSDPSANFDFCTVEAFNLVVKASDPGGN